MTYKGSMTQKLQEYLEEHIKQHPEVASFQFLFEHGSEYISNDTLLVKAKLLASQLKKIGFQPKDRAVLLGENSLEWMITYLAVLYAEGVVATIDTELLADNTCDLIKKMDPAIVFCSKQQFEKLTPLDNALPVVVFQAFDNMMAAFTLLDFKRKETLNSDDYDDNVATIVNSSGTGGKQKGILLTHQNLIDVIAFYQDKFTFHKVENILCVLPCFAIYACAVVLAALANGQRVYFADAKKLGLISILQKQPIQCIPLVPAGIMAIHDNILQNVAHQSKTSRVMFSLLTKLSGFLRRRLKINVGKKLFAAIHKTLGSHLDIIFTGGAPLNPAVTKNFYSWGYTIFEGYGLTETAGVITSTEGHYKTIGSCGKRLKDVTIIINQADKTGSGEVLISGNRLMAGYFRDPEANAHAWVGQVFITSDLGKIDKKGNLHILGRSKEIIIDSDERKTLPQDVEIRYQHLEGIAKLAVVGITDTNTRADVIHAAIVPNQHLLQKYQGNSAALQKHFEGLVFQRAKQLPTYLRIVHVNIVDKIPTNALGKIKRTEIKNYLLAKGPQNTDPSYT